MINAVGNNHIKSANDLQMISSVKTYNNQNVFSLENTNENTGIDMSKMSPLDLTVNSKGETCTILSEKIKSSNQERPAMVQRICNRYNDLKSTLTINKKYLPKIIGLCSKIESKLDDLMRAMDQALISNTKETLSLNTCATVEKLDDKMEIIEAKLEAAFNEFCAKTDILVTLTAILPTLDGLLEQNPGSAKEIEELIGEIISSMDGSLSKFSGAKDAKEINEQSQKKIEKLTSGDIQKKMKEIEEKIEKAGQKDESENFFGTK